MTIELAQEKYSGSVGVLSLGATPAEGGTRSSVVKVGGETAYPFLFREGAMPNRPVVALEILDCEPAEWPDGLKAEFGSILKDPLAWAKRCAVEYGAKVLSVRLMGAHPDWGTGKIAGSVAFLKKLITEVKTPLIVLGCGDPAIDNVLLTEASQATKGERCLFGIATQKDYRTLTACCIADGHSLIAESPIDVNIAKQVNILTSEMGLDPARIVMHPTTASLGYGMEYVFSIMERARQATFIGDKMLSMPFILFAGQEVWRVKEAKENVSLGVTWEAATACAMLHAGADILVMRHPGAAQAASRCIDVLMEG